MNPGEDVRTELEKYLEHVRRRRASRREPPQAPGPTPELRRASIPIGTQPPPQPSQQRYTFRVVLQLNDKGEVEPELLIPSDLPRTPTTKEALALKSAAVFAVEEAGVKVSRTPLTIEIIAPLKPALGDHEVEAVFPMEDPRLSRLR